MNKCEFQLRAVAELWDFAAQCETKRIACMELLEVLRVVNEWEEVNRTSCYSSDPYNCHVYVVFKGGKKKEVCLEAGYGGLSVRPLGYDHPVYVLTAEDAITFLDKWRKLPPTEVEAADVEEESVAVEESTEAIGLDLPRVE